jgi:hypothetical protein
VTFAENGFTVEHGWLEFDPYTGARVEYTRLDDPDQEAVVVDHLVSIEDAWNSGGNRWPRPGDKWDCFLNDPDNLVVIAASVDKQKGGQSAATWLPPRREIRHFFVTQQMTIKRRYGLSVTVAERDAWRAVLANPERNSPRRPR